MSKASRAFDALVQEFYEAWLRFHPARALQAGISGYEGRFPAVDEDDFGALCSLLESLIVGLEEIDFHRLDDDRQTDLQVLFGAAQAEHQCLLQRDWRHRDPGAFLPFDTLRELLLYAQTESGGALKQCLADIPAFLRHARSQILTVPELVPRFWVEAAVDEAHAGLGCLSALRDSPMVRRCCRAPAQVQALVETAAAAVGAYAAALECDVAPLAAGVVGAGPPLYAFLLRQRFFLTVDPDRLQRLAARKVGELAGAIGSLSNEVCGSERIEDWLVGLDTGVVGELVEQARERCQQVRRLVEENRLAELPARSQLRLSVVPPFVLPSASLPAYLAPPMGDPELIGTIYLPASGASLGARLGVFDACLALGWAGRHLQSTRAAASPAAGTLVRRLNPCPGLLGGWPLYAEGMLLDNGYEAAPWARFAVLISRYRSALKAQLDAEIHLAGLAPQAAVERLAAVPGETPEHARFEVLRLTREPARAMAALVGWLLIEAVRDLLRAQDPGHSIAGFHHQLLAQGPVALPLVIQGTFGQPAWDAALERLDLL